MLHSPAMDALGLRGAALTPGAQRAWWLREALAGAEDLPVLRSEETADVVIVGGGFTGLWTAYHLSRLRPELGIAILEQDVCGGGASGRNGGFASGWWDELDGLVKLYGAEGAIAICRELAASINAIGAFCAEHGVDAWYRHAGYVFAATTGAHEESAGHMVELAAVLGLGDEMRSLSAEDVRARCASPAFRSGAFMRDAASVQPALLARGLRRVVLARGVRIYEHTPVLDLRSGTAVVARTTGGSVTARQGVLALNAWAVGWPRLRRRVVAWSSYIVLTAPAPERLAEIGWTGGEVISDLRASLRYFRTTADGRIAFGGGGGRAAAHIGDSFTHDERAVREAAEGFRRYFPSFAEVPIEDAWGGPIDVSPTHLPTFGRLDPNLFYALGYTGNGVAPSHLAGQALAALLAGEETAITRLPMVGARQKKFPMEPFRRLGTAVIRRAMIATETAAERGREPNPLTAAVARLPRRLGYLLGPE